MFKSSFAREIMEAEGSNTQQPIPNDNTVDNDNITENINLSKNVSYPKEERNQRHTIYKSNFAASTHSTLDFITSDTIDLTSKAVMNGGNNGERSRYPLPSRNCSINTYRGGIGSDEHLGELTTSDLGTSDFSSSEILSSNSTDNRGYSADHRAYNADNRGFSADIRNRGNHGNSIDDLYSGIYAGINRNSGGIKENITAGGGFLGSVKDLSSIYSNLSKDCDRGSSSLYSSSDKGEKGSSNSATTSFLNLQSQMPFNFLQQVCSDLDVGLTASDWSTLKQTVLPPTGDDEDSRKSSSNGGNEEINNLVVLGDFLSELQSLRRGLGGKGERRSSRGTPESLWTTDSDEGMTKDEDLLDSGYGKDSRQRSLGSGSFGNNNEDNLTSKEMSAKLAAKELETLQVRLECQHLFTENLKLRQEFKELKGVSNPRRVLDLQKEIEHLHWQLNKMENSRKLYELATTQLVTFLEQVSHSLAYSTVSRSSSRLNIHQDSSSPDPVLSRENLLHARELSLASLNMARSQSMPGLAGSLAAFGGAFTASGGSGLTRRSRLMRGASREGSCSGMSVDSGNVRRSNSVSRTRLASPLPSLAEQEDRRSELETISTISQDPAQSTSADITENLTDSLSLDSHRVYRRSISAQDPLCMSTPRQSTNKSKLQASASRRSSNNNAGIRSSASSTISINTDKTDDYLPPTAARTTRNAAVERRRSRIEAAKPERNYRINNHSSESIYRRADSVLSNRSIESSATTNRSTVSTSADRSTTSGIGGNNVNVTNKNDAESFENSVDCISVVSVEQSVRSDINSVRSGKDTSASTVDLQSVRSIELLSHKSARGEFESKRGTLTSLSSGSTSASPPSTTTSRSREYTSDDSISGSKSKSKSMTTLNSGDGESTTRTQLAATAQRLLRSLKFVLAREKSYNIVSAEGKYYRDRGDSSSGKSDSDGKMAVKGSEKNSSYKGLTTVRRQEKAKDRKAVRTRSEPNQTSDVTTKTADFETEGNFHSRMEDNIPAQQEPVFRPRGQSTPSFDARSTAPLESRSILKTKVAIVPSLSLDKSADSTSSLNPENPRKYEENAQQNKSGAKRGTKNAAPCAPPPLAAQEMRNLTKSPEQSFRHLGSDTDEYLHASRQNLAGKFGDGEMLEIGGGNSASGGKFNDDVMLRSSRSNITRGNTQNMQGLSSKDKASKDMIKYASTNNIAIGRYTSTIREPVEKPARTSRLNQAVSRFSSGGVETATMKHHRLSTELTANLKRSKSDAQDIFVPLVTSSTDEHKSSSSKAAKKPLSAIVKRSRSFQKIFSTPNILGRSKEYYFN